MKYLFINMTTLGIILALVAIIGFGQFLSSTLISSITTSVEESGECVYFNEGIVSIMKSMDGNFLLDLLITDEITALNDTCEMKKR